MFEACSDMKRPRRSKERHFSHKVKAAMWHVYAKHKNRGTQQVFKHTQKNTFIIYLYTLTFTFNAEISPKKWPTQDYSTHILNEELKRYNSQNSRLTDSKELTLKQKEHN